MQKVVTAGQAIVECLIRAGVDRIFGIPGVHTYHLFDALYERRDEITFIGSRHEQGAAYMAFGYAKSTGRIGVYTCVPGPGLLNTTAALCSAYSANAPVLCLTSEIPAADIGRGYGILHELPDQLAVLRGLTKWAERIDHPTSVPRVFATAMEHLTTGRIGPVALECPWDTLSVKALVDFAVSVRSVAQYPGVQIESLDSNFATITPKDVFPPPAPQDLVAAFVPAAGETAAYLDLSWSISAATDIAGYNVYRSEEASGPGTRVNSELLLTPAFRDMNVAPGRHYLYTVTAVNRAGNESPESAAIAGSVPDLATPAESQPQ